MGESIDDLRKLYYKNNNDINTVNYVINKLESMNNSGIPSKDNSDKVEARKLLEDIEKHQKRMENKYQQALVTGIKHINNNRVGYSVLGLGSGIGLVVVSSTMCFMLIVLIFLCISSYFYLTKKSSKKK